MISTRKLDGAWMRWGGGSAGKEHARFIIHDQSARNSGSLFVKFRFLRFTFVNQSLSTCTTNTLSIPLNFIISFIFFPALSFYFMYNYVLIYFYNCTYWMIWSIVNFTSNPFPLTSSSIHRSEHNFSQNLFKVAKFLHCCSKISCISASSTRNLYLYCIQVHGFRRKSQLDT